MSRGWTAAAVRAKLAQHEIPARAKFGNKKVQIDGIWFDSKKEGEHYLTLKMRERLKEIRDLELQPVFHLHIRSNDGEVVTDCGHYTADFRFWERYCGQEVLRVVDVKSSATKTEAYQRTKKIVEALYRITIIEV